MADGIERKRCLPSSVPDRLLRALRTVANARESTGPVNRENWARFAIRTPFADRAIPFGILMCRHWPERRSIDVPVSLSAGDGSPTTERGRWWSDQWQHFPPCGFVARAMDLAMMDPAQRHGELITDLAAQRAVLGEAQMAGVGGRRPQIRQACLATNLTCSLSRKRRGSGWVSRLLSMYAPARLRGRCASLM